MILETKPSMLRRCRDWDYRDPSIYMVTLTLADRRSNALGRLVEDSAPRVEASPLGEAVLAHWKRLGETAPGVEPLFGVVMPDHFHGILRVSRRLPRPLGSVVAAFKAGTTKVFRGLKPAAQNKREEPPVGRVALNAPSAKNNAPSAPPQSCSVPGASAPGLWSQGFNDKILFREGQLAAMFDYLRDNPRRLAVKRRNPWLFRVVRDLRLDLGFPARFAALGNDALLRSPNLVQVQCSRRLAVGSAAFAELRGGFVAAARRGAVLVSPCISEGEREIVRAALAEGGSVVALKNKGFSPLGKPGGRLFDLCAVGRLLLLAPGNWPYTPAVKPMTRLDACALNRIAQLVAGDGAAEISYRGMTPAGIDALARDACGVPDRPQVCPVPGASAPGRERGIQR